MSQREEKNLLAFLILNRLRIEGRRRVVELLSEGKRAHEIYEQVIAGGYFKGQQDTAFMPEKEMENCARKGIDFLVITDPDYPALLKEIPDPPLLLYVKGEILKSDQNALAIVGTRHPSFYGRTQAKRFGQDLASKGLTIVSGFARGIDQIAHEAALQISHGRTLAVMGCGLDVVYPKENMALYEKIPEEHGAILSEYPLGTPPLPENFPRRNRILSGLSYGVFVVEAHSRSGSLITAHQALEQGREVFALPGPVDQLTSYGTHQLLKEGALLVESPEDIFEALALRLKIENKFKSSTEAHEKPMIPAVPFFIKSTVKNISSMITAGKKVVRGEGDQVSQRLPFEPGKEKSSSHDLQEGEVLGSVSSEDVRTLEEVLREEGPLMQDEILEFTGLEPSRLPGLLLQLELAKKIRRLSDGKFSILEG